VQPLSKTETKLRPGRASPEPENSFLQATEQARKFRSFLKEGINSNNLKDYLIEKLFFACGILVIILLLMIMWFLVSKAWPALMEVGLGEFLTGTRWNPGSPIEAGYGALAFILASIFITAGALIIAVPWGIFSSIFIGEIAPARLKEFLKPVVEILAIFPSVVLGFFALVVLGPFIANLFGLSSGLLGLTGAIILGIMTLPTIISISEDSLNSVPQQYREASYALGASRWETVRYVSLPAARSGIIAGIMLGFGRSVGETMAVLMAVGNALSLPLTYILNIPIPTLLRSMRTLTANIAIEGSDVAWGSLHYHSLFVLGVILFVITFAVNLVADIMLHRFQEVNQGE